MLLPKKSTKSEEKKRKENQPLKDTKENPKAGRRGKSRGQISQFMAIGMSVDPS